MLSGVPLSYRIMHGVKVPSRARDSQLGLAAVATRELGLTLMQADALFSASNSLHVLWQLAQHFTEGDIHASEMDMITGSEVAP